MQIQFKNSTMATFDKPDSALYDAPQIEQLQDLESRWFEIDPTGLVREFNLATTSPLRKRSIHPELISPDDSKRIHIRDSTTNPPWSMVLTVCLHVG